MKILSADPGKQGAIVISDYSGGLVNVKFQINVMPLLKNKKDYDIRTVKKIFDENEYDLIVVEDVASIPGSSARSNFQFGFGVGMLRAMAETSGIPYLLTHPKTWQKIAWEGIRKVKNPKENSLVAAHRLFPNENFIATKRSSVPHNGAIDAALLGYYGYIKHNNK